MSLTPVISPSKEITLHPKPGFVVKTKLLTSTRNPDRLAGTKVFVNVCYDENVPKPSVDFAAEVVFPLIMNNEWEIPIIVSLEKRDKDKKGQLSIVYDCCINDRSMRWVQANKDLRLITIEWCLESLELSNGFELMREYSIPKMASKGELTETKIPEKDLTENKLKKEIEKLQNNETLALLEAVNGEELDMDDDLPDLLGINKSSQTTKKPLIEEISDMKISPVLKINQIEQKTTTQAQLPPLTFQTTFKKLSPPINTYKLLIEIKSENTSSLDYDLTYHKENHSLLLKNLNPRYKVDQTLELPLPLEFQNVQFKSFYTKDTESLHIFIK